jgi:hypothetical protein
MSWALFFLLSFFDPGSGLHLEIPDKFYLIEEEPSYYTYKDLRGTQLTLEIEENDEEMSHYEHFHQALTKGADEKEQMICGGLEFKSFSIGPLIVTKCGLKILAMAEKYCEPLYLCDYLFVNGHHTFTLSVEKPDDGTNPDDWAMPLLESITFTEGTCPKSLTP